MTGLGARAAALGASALVVLALGGCAKDAEPSVAQPGLSANPTPTGPRASAPSAATPSATQAATPPATPPATPETTPASGAASGGRRLSGLTVVIDPGHQLGNSRFPAQINALVDAGGLRKACNTTGTATNSGVPEATMTWQVAVRLRTALVRRGATVVLTRDSNSSERWGPCVDERGRSGAEGDLLVSLHGDGNTAAGAHGFHVIVPSGGRSPLDRSAALGGDLRDGLVGAGLVTSTYLGTDNGVVTRSDLGTLNLSPSPVSMVELGNMRDASDAALLTSSSGQRQIVRGLVEGITTFHAG